MLAITTLVTTLIIMHSIPVALVGKLYKILSLIVGSTLSTSPTVMYEGFSLEAVLFFAKL